MGNRLRGIESLLAAAVFGIALPLGGCIGGPGMGGFIAAGATMNAMNAAGKGNLREAAAWGGVAEYGRAKVISDAVGRDGGNNDEDGIVTLHLKGDQVYRGEILNGRPHGTGKLQYPNGGWYRGEFRYGKREGYGRIEDCKGNVWEGSFHKDLWEGEFRFIGKDGKELVQFYLEDRLVSKEEFERAKGRD